LFPFEHSLVWTGSEIFSNQIGRLGRQMWDGVAIETDSGIIFTFYYKKMYPETGLRLTASGDHRLRLLSGYSMCSRW